MTVELIGIIAYVILMLIVGFWVAKSIKTDDDYFLAGRSLGPTLATFLHFCPPGLGPKPASGTAGALQISA